MKPLDPSPLPAHVSSAPRPGLVPRLWRALAGERDPVDAQLRELARQGAVMARLAHVAAFLLLILFSLGSLVSLSADALAQVLNDWQLRGQVDFPAAISVAVSTVLVLCMDTAALYAASMLRVLAARGASKKERRVHKWVLIIACALESGTFAYMGWTYDHPASLVAWALIIARAAGAPVFAVYLSLARPLPVGPRDILHGVENASGAGVLRDTVAIAADPAAPLAQKAAIFNASALMVAEDRKRLAGLLDVVTCGPTAPTISAAIEASAAPVAALPAPATGDASSPDDQPPTGPGSPSAVPDASKHGEPGKDRRRDTAAIQLVEPPEWQREPRPRRRTASAEQRVRRVLAADPAISTRRLAKRAHVSDSTASKYRALWGQERDGGEQQQAQ